MSENSYDLKAAYDIVKKIYLAILAGPVLFLIVALLIREDISSSALDINDPLNLGLLIVILFVPVGSVVSRRIFSAAKSSDDARIRMMAFQKGMIIRLASYEAVELFSIVVFILSGNILVLLFAAVALVGIIMIYPRPSLLKQTVGINELELL